MVVVRRRGDESLDALLRRFRRRVGRAGIMAEVRRRERYLKPSTRRHRRRRYRERGYRDRGG